MSIVHLPITKIQIEGTGGEGVLGGRKINKMEGRNHFFPTLDTLSVNSETV